MITTIIEDATDIAPDKKLAEIRDSDIIGELLADNAGLIPAADMAALAKAQRLIGDLWRDYMDHYPTQWRKKVETAQAAYRENPTTSALEALRHLHDVDINRLSGLRFDIHTAAMTIFKREAQWIVVETLNRAWLRLQSLIMAEAAAIAQWQKESAHLFTGVIEPSAKMIHYRRFEDRINKCLARATSGLSENDFPPEIPLLIGSIGLRL